MKTSDNIHKVKARVMLAEGNLYKELHTAIRILTTKDRTMTKLSAKRFIAVTIREEITYDDDFHAKIVDGGKLKLVVRKTVEEMSLQKLTRYHA